MELVGDRVTLREFGQDDHAAVHAYAADPLVTRYTDWGPNSPEDTVAFLGDTTEDAGIDPRTTFCLAITAGPAATLIGGAELRITSRAHRLGELGYVLDPAWWGRGYATEAAGLLVDLGFTHLGLGRISATCRPDNLASIRVLTRIGMRREGHLREHLLVRGRRRDSLLFAMLADDRPAR